MTYMINHKRRDRRATLAAGAGVGSGTCSPCLSVSGTCSPCQVPVVLGYPTTYGYGGFINSFRVSIEPLDEPGPPLSRLAKTCRRGRCGPEQSEHSAARAAAGKSDKYL